MVAKQQPAAPWAPKIVVDHQEVNEWLGRLGLPRHALDETIDRMVAAARECTFFDAPTRAGSEMWFVGVRVLREQLVRGDGVWTPLNRKNHALVVSSNGNAVAIAGGDEGTGDPAQIPSTKHTRGPEWMRAIQANQAVLPGMLPQFSPTAPLDPGRGILGGLVTWVLLVHQNRLAMWAELSCPAEFVLENGEIQVCGWEVRLILRRKGDSSEGAAAAQASLTAPAPTAGPIPHVELREQSGDGTLQSPPVDHRPNAEGADEGRPRDRHRDQPEVDEQL